MDDPVAVLVRYHTPTFYKAVVAWYYVAPGVAVFLGGQLLLSTSRIWFARWGGGVRLRARLPDWPLSPTSDGPAIVIGEVHHPVNLVERATPDRLIIPERGLYTGAAIVGAVGSGKTSACLHPFARQLLSWHATNPERRAAAIVLEVKGDLCHDIRRMLADVGREDDYLELSMSGGMPWNPLSAWWLDSYSLTYTVASLLNQLFGKGKEPFWQQAYTNLVQWIIELYRVLPGEWVTLQDVYHCAIDKQLFAHTIEQAQTFADALGETWIVLARPDYLTHLDDVDARKWKNHPADPDGMTTRGTPELVAVLKKHDITYRLERTESKAAKEIRLRVEAVHRWYVHDWNTLDNKIRSSIVEGVSVFLSMFDLPSVARVFCPPPPGPRSRNGRSRAGRRPRRTGRGAPPAAHGRGAHPGASAARSAHRRREGARPQHARRHQSRARPRHRRHAQECVAVIAPPPAGEDEDIAGPVRPAGRLSVRRVSGVRQRRRGRPARRRESLCAHPAVPRDPDRRHAIHLVAPIGPGQLRGVADPPANAPHPDLLLAQ